MNLGNTLIALACHRSNTPLAKVDVTDTIPRRERQVTVVAHRSRDLIGPLGFWLGSITRGTSQGSRTRTTRVLVARPRANERAGTGLDTEAAAAGIDERPD